MSDLIRKSLHELIEEPISGTRPKGGVTYEGDIPSFGGENVTMTGGLDFYPVKKVSADFFHQMKRGQLQDLDVLINKDGANTGKSAIYRKSPYKDACINEHLFILRGNNGQLDQNYLHYLLLSPSIKKTLETKITGSAQPGLNSSFCQNFPIEIVPLPEQKKIAAILTSVDKVIENTQKQIDKLQDLKKATMNELLTKGIGHTEFKDSELGRIPKSWRVVPLSEMVSVDKEVLRDGVIDDDYLFHYIDIASVKTGVINKPSHKISFGEAPSRARRVVRKGDVLLSTVRPNLQAFAYMEEDCCDCVCSTGFSVLRPNEDNDGRFVYFSTLLDSISKQIDALVAGSNYPAINSSDVKKLSIIRPSLQEQKKISTILTSIEKDIENKRRKLQQTQSLKKSLMQDLLTGKVRTTGTQGI